MLYKHNMSIAEKQDRVFKALAARVRRQILDDLRDQPLTTGTLCAHFDDLDRCTVMQHLRVLEKCRLVHSSKTGRVRTCEVDLEQLAVVEQWLGSLRQLWEQRFGRLDTLLSTLQEEDK